VTACLGTNPIRPFRFRIAAFMPRSAAIALILAGFSLTDMIGADDKPITAKPWSFAPVREQVPPTVSDPAWTKNQIDPFILVSIEKAGLKPAPPADARTLLRRMWFDLVGLPPSQEAVEAFSEAVKHNRPAAIRAVVDELLASPHYGERWGRHWLDLARYTDIPEEWLGTKSATWLYRDWVVKAFNDDLPYPQFVKQQLAADLMPNPLPQDNAALGFLGLGPTYWKELQLPPEIISVTVAEEWEERVDAVGRTFLGLTLACARCHDHKSDPVTARDYYAMAGVFASIQAVDRPTLTADLWAPVAKAKAEVAKIEAQQAALKKKKPAPEDLPAQLAALTAQITAIEKATPHYHVPMAGAVQEAALFVKPKGGGQHGTTLEYQPGKTRDLEMQMRGDPNVLGETVPRGFLAALPAADGKPRQFVKGSGRLELAEAIVEEGAPLAARVIVNRIWRHHFGRGIVETPSEFGALGETPTHPELLDDLTARFIARGWSIKWLHREILNSATWQQSSHAPESEAKDPANTHFSRMNRRRLDVEAWRDAMLAVSGQLDRSIGGASLNLADSANRRRTLYGVVHRREMDQMLRLHDFPEPLDHSPKRQETTTPLQMLFTLNGPFVRQQSEALAAKISGAQRVDAAYATLFQRPPTNRERELAAAFLGEKASPEVSVEYAQALLGSNEFLFVD
jgi:hypothetical protein